MKLKSCLTLITYYKIGCDVVYLQSLREGKSEKLLLRNHLIALQVRSNDRNNSHNKLYAISVSDIAGHLPLRARFSSGTWRISTTHIVLYMQQYYGISRLG